MCSTTTKQARATPVNQLVCDGIPKGFGHEHKSFACLEYINKSALYVWLAGWFKFRATRQLRRNKKESDSTQSRSVSAASFSSATETNLDIRDSTYLFLASSNREI